MNRPSWSNYLLGIAKIVSCRSHDTQTQHGCVIVGPDHRVISTGTNGFPRGMKDDSRLPTTRPEKYAWMLHSEENAVANAIGSLEGSTAYITGRACLHCMMVLHQHGVKRIIQKDGRGWTKDEAEAADRAEFLEQSSMLVEDVKPDLSWLVDMVLDDEELRSILINRGWNKQEVVFSGRSTLMSNCCAGGGVAGNDCNAIVNPVYEAGAGYCTSPKEGGAS